MQERGRVEVKKLRQNEKEKKKEKQFKVNFKRQLWFVFSHLTS